MIFCGSKHKKWTGVGIFILSPDGVLTRFHYKIKGECSNNEAKYEALIIGLQIMLDVGIKDIDIKGDLELLVKQFTKEYKCFKDHLVMYVAKALSLLEKYDNKSISHDQHINDQSSTVRW